MLLDDEEEREKMLKYFGKEAKGYEMEGFSIAEGAIDCIIVKGVCDFASGNNKIWQPTAALAAIDCLYHDLSRMDLSLMKDVIQKGIFQSLYIRIMYVVHAYVPCTIIFMHILRRPKQLCKFLTIMIFDYIHFFKSLGSVMVL